MFNLKKSFAVFSAVVFTLTLLAVCAPVLTVNAATEPELILDFTDEYTMDDTNARNTYSNLVWDTDEGYLHIVSTNGPDEGGNGDPNMIFNFDQYGYLDADTYHYMKIKLRNHSEVTRFQLHFSTTTRGLEAATSTLFDLSTNDTDFVTYVIDVAKANEDSLPISKEYTPSITDEESLWTGDVNTIRLDFLFDAYPGGQVPTGSEMDIEYVAFFASEEDANAWELGTKPDPTEPPATTEPEATETPEVTETPDNATEAPATSANTSVPTASAATATGSTDESSGGISTPVIIAIAAAAVVVIAVVVIVIVKKKK